MRLRASVSVIVCTVSLVSCRGAGHSALPAMTNGLASFTITTPYDAQSGPQTKSVSVTLTGINGAPPATGAASTVFNLSRTAPGCALTDAATMSCTVKITAPAGNDSFSVVSFAQPGAHGIASNTDTVSTRISAGRATNCVKRTH